MYKLIVFQSKRMWNNKSLLLLPILLIIIGISGIFLSNIFYPNATAKLKLLSVYNAYSQFTFLFLIYLFVSTFATDYKNGVYAFMNQIGFPIRKFLLSKSIILFVNSFIITNIIIIMTNFVFSNNDYEYLGILLISINLTLIFTILFSMLLSIVVCKTMPATLIGFGAYVIMNIINFIGYGITNPADSNSISYITLSSLAGQEITHYTLSKININFYENRYIFIIIPIVLWIGILSVIIMIILKKRGRK